MSLPPLWKVRRELWRVVGKARFAVMQRSKARTSLQYHGLAVPLHRSGMSAAVVKAILSNYYEDPEIRGLTRVIHPGDRVLELGAGLGIITALAARAASPGGRVVSYEANPRMIEDTKVFLAGHGVSNVELRHAVLIAGAKPGETRNFHLGSSFSVSSLLEGEGRKAREVVSVPAEDLNSAFAEFGPDVLLCDIEGGEIDLIPALDASRLRAVVIELHPDRLTAEQLQTIRDALAGHGLLPSHPAPGGTVEVFVRPSAA